HLVAFLALGGDSALAGAAAVQLDLDVRLGKGNAGRAAVHDAADGRTVGFAPGRKAEDGAEGAAGHTALFYQPGAAECWRPVSRYEDYRGAFRDRSRAKASRSSTSQGRSAGFSARVGAPLMTRM